MTDAWMPEQPEADENNDGGPPNTAAYSIVGGALVVIAGLIAMLTVVDFGSDDGVVNVAASAEVIEAPLLAPVFNEPGEEGIDPFFPLELQLAGYTDETGETPTSDEIRSGVFGGTLENSCDPQRLIDFLMSNPDRGQAWARAQDIAFEEIPEYIGALNVRTLAAPSTVLNHHFDEETGEPYQIETTLETGTAVLVDDNGDIRARCYCGNPTKPKEPGHRPPRCVLMPGMVYARLGDTDPLADVPGDVELTGRTTADEEWTEISWGSGEDETGWTASDNLSPNLCFEAQVVQAETTSTPEPTVAPTVEPTPTEATPEPTAVEEESPPPPPAATATPTPPPAATATPTPPPPAPTSTPAPTPTPEATVAPPVQPFQPFCSVDKRTVAVGESVTFTAGNVPDSVEVEYQIAHGDGTVGSNPSTTAYDMPGAYLASARWEIDGTDDFITCGTVDVLGDTETESGTCPASDFIGLAIAAAQALADSRGCPHRDNRFPGTTDYRPERLNFTVNSSEIVIAVDYG